MKMQIQLHHLYSFIHPEVIPHELLEISPVLPEKMNFSCSNSLFIPKQDIPGFSHNRPLISKIMRIQTKKSNNQSSKL
jgi:hypothetical protein